MRHVIRTLTATLVTLSFVLGFSLALPTPAHAADQGTKVVAFQKGAKAKAYTGQVNVNTASPGELTLLPGIGPAKAKRIVELRQKRPFKRPADLVRVKGIGPKTVKKLMPYLKVSGNTDFRQL